MPALRVFASGDIKELFVLTREAHQALRAVPGFHSRRSFPCQVRCLVRIPSCVAETLLASFRISQTCFPPETCNPHSIDRTTQNLAVKNEIPLDHNCSCSRFRIGRMVPRGRLTYAILSADSCHTGFRHGGWPYSLAAARENHDRQGAADYHCGNGKGERGCQDVTAWACREESEMVRKAVSSAHLLFRAEGAVAPLAVRLRF
jgi:hypothetical protein